MGLRQSLMKTRLYGMYRKYPLYPELRRYILTIHKYKKEAKAVFVSGKAPGGSWADYKDAMKKHMVSVNEYLYSYEYWKLDEPGRDAFISNHEMSSIVRKSENWAVWQTFWDKAAFLRRFQPYVSREWLVPKESSFEAFARLVESKDCVVKPLKSTHGDGVYKLKKVAPGDTRKLYDELRKKDVILEEHIRSCDEINEFHPHSLNTIRVVTFSNNERSIPFGALLRIGAHGSFLDNTHAGGVFAPIDIETGRLSMEGIDTNGNRYEFHPDSGKRIKDFQIPHWDEVLKTCQEASLVMPGTFFAGWDICIRENGKVEIIEGNGTPDFDGGMQAPFKIGVKDKVRQLFKELHGFDPMSLTKWYSKAHFTE